MTAGPLAGLRVIEVGSLIAGPFAGRLMADLGAEVIKVEAPGRLDPLREWGNARHRGRALWWPIQSRGKRLVTLDLAHPEGRDLFLDLIEEADVVLENFRPGVLERWNLAPERLRMRNPSLVVTRVSAYGQTGPYAGRVGFASVAEAVGGMRYLNGHPGEAPPRSGLSLGDSIAALFAVIGTLAAVVDRAEHRSAGQDVDVSLLEAIVAMLESVVPEYSATGAVRQPTGTVLPGLAPSNVYRSGDGEWIVIAANQDALFARLCNAIGRPELAHDGRFRSHVERGRHQREIDAIVAEWAATLPAAEIDAKLAAAGVACGPVHSVDRLVEDPHVRAREVLIMQMDPEVGPLAAPNVVPRFSRTPGSVRWSGKWDAGADNEAVYGALGRDAAELERLRKAGAI